MKKGKIIQDIKTNTSMPVLISTLFYVFLASLFIVVGKYEKKPFKMRLLRCISFFLVANLVAKDI